MKDHLLQIATRAPVDARRNLAREYLQHYLLRLLQQHGRQRELAFCGGTALRLLHELPRFSEDLDFTATRGIEPEASKECFEAIAKGAREAGHRLSAKLRTERAVTSAMFRFEGLPAELGLSDDPRLALSVKLEVDTAPPAGAGTETTLIQRYFPLALVHHDLPSLFAGKLHALLARPWSKGRDWYDLVWYLTVHRGLRPNTDLLAAALSQTGHDATLAQDWPRALAARLAELDFTRLSQDVAPFLERPDDWDPIDAERIGELLKRRDR